MSGSPTQDLSRLRIDRGDAEMLRITRTVLLIAATILFEIALELLNRKFEQDKTSRE